MKLTYRGISYDYNPPQAQAAEVVATGNYRGSALKFRKAQKELAQQPSLDLKYRGVDYNTGTPEMVAPPVTVEPTAEAALAIASIDNQVRSLTMNHHRDTKQREQAMLIRVAAQVGLPTQYAFQ